MLLKPKAGNFVHGEPMPNHTIARQQLFQTNDTFASRLRGELKCAEGTEAEPKTADDSYQNELRRDRGRYC